MNASLPNDRAQLAAQKLIEYVESVRLQVLRQAKIADLDEKAVAELSDALERMQRRFLHAPLELLNQASRDGNGEDVANWVSRIFQLEADAGKMPALQTANPRR
ncbi:MAG: hypothetical protein V1899_06240 [Planctomycetota bacterium]